MFPVSLVKHVWDGCRHECGEWCRWLRRNKNGTNTAIAPGNIAHKKLSLKWSQEKLIRERKRLCPSSSKQRLKRPKMKQTSSDRAFRSGREFSRTQALKHEHARTKECTRQRTARKYACIHTLARTRDHTAGTHSHIYKPHEIKLCEWYFCHVASVVAPCQAMPHLVEAAHCSETSAAAYAGSKPVPASYAASPSFLFALRLQVTACHVSCRLSSKWVFN